MEKFRSILQSIRGKKISHTFTRDVLVKPTRDWKRILGGIFFGLVVVLVFGAYLYFEWGTGEETLDPEQQLQAKVRAEDIEEALSFFERRATQHEAVRRGASPVVDPSR